MAPKKNISQPLSTEASEFLKMFRNQNVSSSPVIQKNKASQIQIEQQQKQQQNQVWDLQMQSQSLMEAQQLFGNLAPEPVQSPAKQQKQQKQNTKLNKSQKKQLNKKVDKNKEQQKIIQTRSILKKGRIIQQNDQNEIFEQRKQQISEPKEKRKTVQFQGVLPINTQIQKKWNDPIQNQRKGKFDKEQQRILSQSVGKFLVANDISLQQFEHLLSAGQKSDKLNRKNKVFALLSAALPNRSPQSCYKFLKRNFNTLNRKGKWTQQQVDKLKILVQKYGRKWTLISKQMKRTADNCYDKFRQLGQQNMEERIKGIWKFQELVQFLKLIEKMTKIKFLQNKVDRELQRAKQHDEAQQQEVKHKKYNSKNFIFHNIMVLKPFINSKNFQKIDTSKVRWNEISTYLKTRNTLDCRNKAVQLLQIFFHNDSKQIDQLVVDFLILHKYQTQHEINWKDWKDKQVTAQQAKNRFMIMKKMIEGRSIKPFRQILHQLKSRIQRKLKERTPSIKKISISSQQKRKPVQIEQQ